MANFLEVSDLYTNYLDTQMEALKFFEKFDEIERLSANGIRSDLPKHYPRVNDGTLAAMLLENAKRAFPNLFTGTFHSLDRHEAWLMELLGILWSRVIVPGARTDADFYTKFWNWVGYRPQQHGASAAFVFFRADADYTGADFSLDYIRDVMMEPGKVSTLSANYVWRNSYHTRLDIERIISYAEAEDAAAKKENRESYNTWQVGALKEFLNRGPSGKEQNQKNFTERQKQLTAEYYMFSTCFHRGSNAPFYSIIPSLNGRLARTRKNENPTGDVPVILSYHTQDLTNPYGKGLVEIAGPNQNVLDYFTQADVLATQKGVSPPVKIKGAGDAATGFVESSIVHGPDARWRLGNTDVQVVETTTSVYQGLNDRMARYKTNLLTQLGSFDTSTPASAGNPQFSRTSAGVDSLDARTNVNDNFFVNAGMIGFTQLATTMMNIHMANMHGKEVFTLLEDEVERLQRGGWNLGGNTLAFLEYDNLRGKFCFEVDDKTKLDPQETEGMATALKELTPDTVAVIERDGDKKVDLGELWIEYLSRLLPNSIDKVIVPLDAENAAEGNPSPVDGQAQPTGTPGTAQGQTAPAQKAPSESISFKDLVTAGAYDAAAAMLDQAQLPSNDIQAKSIANKAALLPTAQTPQNQPTPTPTQPAPAGTPEEQGEPSAMQTGTEEQAEPAETPQPNDSPAALKAEHQATMKQYGLDAQGAAIVMAARRHNVPEVQIEQYIQHAKGANA